MNQQQRKYVTERVKSINLARQADIQRQFDEEEASHSLHQVIPNYPDIKDILLKLAGFDSPAVLRAEGDDLKDLIENGDSLPVNRRRNNAFQLQYVPTPNMFQALVYPTNQAALETFEAAQNAATQRRQTRLIDRLDALRAVYNRCMDTIVLGEYSEDIQRAIAAFENAVV